MIIDTESGWAIFGMLIGFALGYYFAYLMNHKKQLEKMK